MESFTAVSREEKKARLDADYVNADICERKKFMKNTYLKKEYVWIGNHPDYDVFLPESPVNMLLKGEQLLIKNLKKGIVLKNGGAIQNTDTFVPEGSVLELCGVKITVFSENLEISGEGYNTSLLPVRGDAEYFLGFPTYKRSPRLIYRVKEEKVEIKVPPAKKAMSKGSLAQLIIPSLCMLGFTVAMGIFMKRGAYVYMSAGMTCITMLFSVQKYFADRKNIKQENKKREEIYESYLLEMHKKIRSLRKEERIALDYQNPTPEELKEMVLGYSSRIYERNALEDDFLQVNLGFYSGNSKIEVTFAEKELTTEKDPLRELAKQIPSEYDKIKRIPVSIDLKKAHLGLVGSKSNVHKQLKYLLAQLTMFQSYHDLQIVFIHSSKYNQEFSYTRWYPHLRIQSMNVVAEISSDQVRDQILGSLQQLLKERKLKLEEEKKEAVFLPHLLFIIDEPKLILNHAIMEYLQNRRLELGFSMIYTTDQRANLPENIQTVCLLNNAKDGVLLLEEGEQKNRSFEIQQMDDYPLEKMSRALGALQHEQGISSKIPESITFFELYQINHPEELNIKQRWEKNQSHKTLAVPLGVRAEDDLVLLNLHEKAHGPHGLVAGTTGSGKSEIVQAYILSLAVNFHPHEVGFLLIDYKGGGMANLFKDLPHLLGTITNLDKSESMRAMASIKSELNRRQRIFGECGVNHINGYNKLFKLGKVEEPLPHLFMISDEFAELKKEQPEFMSELISTARIGRSLGIHLILATQKPSGVVDDQIWTNSKFRLCLKVQNAGDSREMLKTPDAANITQSGRAYLQVGNNEIYELFQSAWSGATYGGKEESKTEDNRVYLINALGQGEAINQDFSVPLEGNQIKATQLDVVVGHIHDVYEELDAVPVKKTWLPSLAPQIVSPHMREIVDSAEHKELDLRVGIGLVDIPEEQKQEKYSLDFIKNGHFLYMASIGYGKSVLLQNIIFGLCAQNSVRNLHVYILDLGNSAMIPLRALPHVADYMGFDDDEKIKKFQKLILDEISSRKKKFAKAMAQNFFLYNQTQEEPLKAILIAIDNYDIISELGDQTVSFVQKVARDGASLGIYLIVTITRENVMRGATKSNFKEKMSGFNFESGEISSFIGRSSLELPEEVKGRALVKLDNINMLQLYTPVEFQAEVDYTRNLQELIRRMSAASTEKKAPEIPVLPENLYYTMLHSYPGYLETQHLLPVGIDTDSLEIQYLNLAEGPGLVLGGIGSGKSNTVKTLLQRTSGGKIFILDGMNGILGQYQARENIIYANVKDSIIQTLQKVDEIIKLRQEEYEDAKIDDIALIAKQFCQTLEPVYILIDSLQDLYEQLDEDNGKIDILCEAIQYGCYVLVTSDSKIKKMTKSKFFNLLLASSEGLILGNIKEQGVFSISGIREENRQLDLGYYHRRGETKKIKLIENK